MGVGFAVENLLNIVGLVLIVRSSLCVCFHPGVCSLSRLGAICAERIVSKICQNPQVLAGSPHSLGTFMA